MVIQSERRVVMLSYYFPPLAGVASERAASFARHLVNIGWNVSVVRPEDGHFYHAATLEGERLEDVHVETTRSIELSRWLRRSWGMTKEEQRALVPVDRGSTGNVLRDFVREFVYVPDAQFGWIPFAVARMRRLLGEGNPSLLFSSSVPYSAHVAAMRVARTTGAPWVAEFRDPWTMHAPHLHARTVFRKALNARIETSILRTADRVVVTADRTRELILDRCKWMEPDRVRVVRNGFEPVETAVSVPGPDESLTLVHAGTLHATDDVRPVVEAVALLYAAGYNVRLRALGPPEPWRPFETGHSRAWLEVGGVVSPAEARAAMHEASALLLFFPDPAFSPAVSGKLMEYLGARRPVIASLPASSENRDLLEAYGDGRFLDPPTTECAWAVLRKLLAEHCEGALTRPVEPRRPLEELSRASQTARLAAIFDDALEEHP